MAKIYIQESPVVWASTTALAACATSGSFLTSGYARLVGQLITCTSAVAGSGLRIRQGVNISGTNTWISASDYAPTACSGSAFSLEIVGNVAEVQFRPDTTASIFATYWALRPV